MNITYRQLEKGDYTAVQSMINQSFGLYRYVNNESVLKSFLKVYLYSCFGEASFSCVAEKDGKVMGVIMGKAESRYRYTAHLKPIVSMGCRMTAMAIKSLIHRNDSSDYKRMHQRTEAQKVQDDTQTGLSCTFFRIWFFKEPTLFGQNAVVRALQNQNLLLKPGGSIDIDQNPVFILTGTHKFIT
jgi:hypothetical protein